MKKLSMDGWHGIKYGRSKLAHMFREYGLYHMKSDCGKTLLKDHLGSAIGLQRCKHCEKAENPNV